MNELDLLKDTGRTLDPPHGPSPALRQRVLAAFVTEQRRPARMPWRHQRLAWVAGLAVAALLVVAAALALKPRADDPPAVATGLKPPTTSATSPPHTTDPAPPSPTTLPAIDARLFLHAAATAVRSSPIPRPDQFLHIESVSVRARQVTNREVWKSVDGSRASYSSSGPAAYFLGCKDGKYVGPEDSPETRQRLDGMTCTPQPGYRSDLPTTLAGMRQLLHTKGLTDLVMDVFMQPTPNLLPAETEAVLFEALAELPEVTLVQPVIDAAGRRGVAVSWNEHGSTLRLVFDPAKHAYRSVQIFDPGAVVPSMEDTIVRYEIVDAIPPQ